MTMPDRISIGRLALVGVGLIGSSFALALRRAGAVGTVVGSDRSREHLDNALALGIIDQSAESAQEAVRDADLVFVAVPVCSICDVVGQVSAGLKPGSIVTDGGSVKAGITETCSRLMPAGSSFIGGHPIAGTEHSGPAAAFASLFDSRRCILTPLPDADPAAVTTVTRLWQAAGARVSCMEPHHHDRIFAEISHLPHMAAYALVHAVGTADVEGENVLSYTAGGFRDFTRIASSDPAMWRDIAIMNRQSLLKSIDGFSGSLADLRQRIEQEDGPGLEAFFTIAKQFRDGIA